MQVPGLAQEMASSMPLGMTGLGVGWTRHGLPAAAGPPAGGRRLAAGARTGRQAPDPVAPGRHRPAGNAGWARPGGWTRPGWCATV
jgi:hypothetical protein